MVNMTVFLSDLQAGRSSSTVQVRLLRYWEARNFRRGGELMGVDMLLLDSQSTMVPAIVHVNRLSTHQPNLEAGAVYSLNGFDVTRCGQNYRLSDSPLLIRFSETTSFTKIAETSAPIPLQSFRFRNYSDMLGLASSNTQLPETHHATYGATRMLTINIHRFNTNEDNIQFLWNLQLQMLDPLRIQHLQSTLICQNISTYSCLRIAEKTSTYVSEMVSSLNNYEQTNVHIILHLTHFNPSSVYMMEIQTAASVVESDVKIQTTKDEYEEFASKLQAALMQAASLLQFYNQLDVRSEIPKMFRSALLVLSLHLSVLYRRSLIKNFIVLMVLGSLFSPLKFWGKTQEQEPQRGRMQEIDLGIHTIRSHGGGLASKHKHDWIILVILIAIEIGLQLISPFYRFVGKDMMTDLKYPFNDNTIPIWSVPIYAVLLPIIVFVCFYMKRTCVYDLHNSILGLLFTVLITGVITDSIKLATGRPRPNFYWRCFPDGKEVFDALGGVLCHGEPEEVKEGHKSFPSGHTSWSFAGLGFLSLYLSGKLKAFNREGHVAKLCIVFVPLLAACLVGISRVDDYWHHWQDVFAGGLIGLFVAGFCYRQFYPNPYHDEGWGPYAYFVAAQERGGGQQNGDALRTMSLQVEPTSLENMESGTSTVPR
ncbi:unnamed protein product [Eruca vesicaria subsp. sativa]|uniref:Phosphatidic acid phosphatase type 2/haloperoxidase domain-containing protein n=1 Tax=Eruca vesicaria subsp. sativa TaxID=29727 RepID=A0ABC8LE21_ERUVS|nr:unnamed protein product [Eruca vesicaria subsp. sativa]